MTTAQYNKALETLGLSQGRAAKLMGLSIRTTNGYATGERKIPKLVQLYLELLIKNDKKENPRKQNTQRPRRNRLS